MSGNVTAEQLKNFHPLQDIPVGTPVYVLLDDGHELVTRTSCDPWQLGHGAWVIKVEHQTWKGGFDLNRVRVNWEHLETEIRDSAWWVGNS